MKGTCETDLTPVTEMDGGMGLSLKIEEVFGAAGLINEASVREKYNKLTLRLIEKNLLITTMESCTSGQVASLLTDTEGSSAILKGALVTYSNEAKILAGVPADIIEKYGVYSIETAFFMAETCRRIYKADIGVGVTGSFGNPDPNNKDSVPGEVYFSISTKSCCRQFHCKVPAQPSRLSYKLYMADVIADQLFLIIDGFGSQAE